ncbi:MAG: EAL domain-containing protein [Deltaproteobacteria bacterium]|nr:EAL domain-containing protein [Deltaproteobacteria bacterium]MBW2537649.1 EAL domain-containing protein [Deltaproteobacteria bacterium]
MSSPPESNDAPISSDDGALLGGPGRVLVVDDEPSVRRMLTRLVSAAGYEVDTAPDGHGAQQLLTENAYELVISDVAMPGMDGIELLQMVRRHDLDLPVILVTGQPSLQSAVRAIEYGTFRYLPKPFSPVELTQAVRQAVQMHRMARLKRQALALAGRGAAIPGDLAGLQTRFERALAELWMAFQPIVSPEEQRIFAHEALLRTREATFGNPQDLVATAERLQRTFELGACIRRSAADAFRTHQPEGLLFINLHPPELLDPALGAPDDALTPLADRVVLEVTERVSLESLTDVRSRVGDLREAGFRLAIDDLGAGYAGLTSFAILEPEFVKIDMSLVRDIHQDRLKQKLFRSMSQLCRDMGILIIAEGVEIAEERDALAELGCDLFQGYLFARPAPPFPVVSW